MPSDNIQTDIYPLKRCETWVFFKQAVLPKDNQMVRLAYFASAENNTYSQGACAFFCVSRK